MSRPKIVLIAGPTASGKSTLALEIARKSGGTIINADALQVYSDLPILSAQPSTSDQAELPHKLYGIFRAEERSSVGKWLPLATTAVAAVIADGGQPILVGGTGLYFKAFVEGLAEIPEIPEDVIASADALYATLGDAHFRTELNKLDPTSAEKFARNDRQRSVRAFAVAKFTGKALSDWHKDNKPLKPDYDYEMHLQMPPRDELYKNCDQRFLQMIGSGATDEVQRLLSRKLSSTLPIMKTIGVREFADFFSKKISFGEVVASAQQATRNYAKRQMTWFRNQWHLSA